MHGKNSNPLFCEMAKNIYCHASILVLQFQADATAQELLDRAVIADDSANHALPIIIRHLVAQRFKSNAACRSIEQCQYGLFVWSLSGIVINIRSFVELHSKFRIQHVDVQSTVIWLHGLRSIDCNSQSLCLADILIIISFRRLTIQSSAALPTVVVEDRRQLWI